MPNQAWYDGLKKGFNPDGTVNKSFTYLKDGKNTYADGTPAPTVYESSQAWVNQQQEKNKADSIAKYDQAWAPYGGAPAGPGRSATTGYVAKNDGSDAWKYKVSDSARGMKNPQFISGGYYDVPMAKAAAAPANVSGGQASVPTVAQRMSRMGQAVQKGVNKGKIKSSQLSQYQVPGQTVPANNGQLVNYTGQSSAAQNAITPVLMPQKTLAPPRTNY